MSGRVGSITTAIISNGLIFNMDAANRASYPRSGTTWVDTINNNNGTLINGPIFDSDNDGSIDFDGTDDYVELSSTTNLRPTDAELNTNGFTVSVWLKQESASTTQGVFANDGVGQSNYYGLEFQVISTGAFGMHKLDGGSPASANRSSASTTSAVLALNTWTHVMYVMPTANKITWKIYVNGVSQALTTSGTGANVAYLNGTAAIGAIRTDKFWNGKISNIKIYNRELSSTEVLHNYNALKNRFI